MDQPRPDHILQVGTGFWASKTLLSAVELQLFTELSKHPQAGFHSTRVEHLVGPDSMVIGIK